MEKVYRAYLNIIFIFLGIITLSGLTSCSTMSIPNLMPSFTGANSQVAAYNPDAPLWSGQTEVVWDKLQHISVTNIKKMREKAMDQAEIAWLDLALISKYRNTSELINSLIEWRAQNPNHPANALFPSNNSLQQLLNQPSPQKIAVLLPQQGKYSSASKEVREGFLQAYYFNLSQGVKQSVKFYDTSNTSVIHSYQLALSEGADFVVGPLVKNEVQELERLGSFSYPTLALNYTDSNNSLPNNFYEFGLLPEDEANQMANRAHSLGLSKALIIAPKNAWGQRLTAAVSAQWIAVGGVMQDTLYYSQSSNYNTEIANFLKIDTKADKKLMEKNNNKALLEQQRRQDFDVIFLLAQPQSARLIVPLLHYYYVTNTPILATSSVYSGKDNPARDADLNGVTICDIPWGAQTTSATSNEAATSHTNRLYAVGQDAYALTEALPRLLQLPYFPIYSKTGALSVSAQHKIHRRLPCMTIRNGSLQ